MIQSENRIGTTLAPNLAAQINILELPAKSVTHAHQHGVMLREAWQTFTCNEILYAYGELCDFAIGPTFDYDHPTVCPSLSRWSKEPGGMDSWGTLCGKYFAPPWSTAVIASFYSTACCCHIITRVKSDVC